MNIAVIGWGSLIWCPRTLQIEPGWHRDGPMLPIEFARKSSDGRLTLVIHAGCRKQRTYWANSSCERLCDAIETLKSVRAEVPQERYSFCRQRRIRSSRRLEERERGVKVVDEDRESRCRHPGQGCRELTTVAPSSNT